MSKLSGNLIRAAQQFTVDYDPHAHAVRDTYIDEILRPG